MVKIGERFFVYVDGKRCVVEVVREATNQENYETLEKEQPK
jgi:hypothetical protein